MTAVAVELLPAPPESGTLDLDHVELIADTDQVLTGCSCSADDDQPY
jgi:hypothetical protein